MCSLFITTVLFLSELFDYVHNLRHAVGIYVCPW